MPLTRDFIQNKHLEHTWAEVIESLGRFVSMIYSNSFPLSWNKKSTTTIDSSGKSTHEKTGREGRVVSAGAGHTTKTT